MNRNSIINLTAIIAIALSFIFWFIVFPAILATYIFAGFATILFMPITYSISLMLWALTIAIIVKILMKLGIVKERKKQP